MRIDICIPTKGESTLPLCIESIKRNVPVNNLIVVCPRYVKENVEKLANIIVVFDEKMQEKLELKV